jgi:hypothetical protein
MRPWKAAAQIIRPSMTGALVTSATRSSSVAPFGRATVPSQSGAPFSALTAISLPPGKPAKTYFSTPPGWPSRAGTGGCSDADRATCACRWPGHRRPAGDRHCARSPGQRSPPAAQRSRCSPWLSTTGCRRPWKGEHIALRRAHDEHPRIGADAARERLFGLDSPDRLPSSRRTTVPSRAATYTDDADHGRNKGVVAALLPTPSSQSTRRRRCLDRLQLGHLRPAAGKWIQCVERRTAGQHHRQQAPAKQVARHQPDSPSASSFSCSDSR